jgi:hypothetical protein
MILEIRLSNFYSIKEEVVLDLRAGNIKNKKADELTANTFFFEDTQILKSVALYGANASGKSNIIRAVQFCISMIINSHLHNENDLFNFKRFKFDGYEKKPSNFFIRFVTGNIEYEYSFSLSRTEIITESLYFIPKGRKAKIFWRDERNGNEKNKVYSFGTSIKKPMQVADNTSRKTLWLSRASQMDRSLAKELYRFFSEKFVLYHDFYSIPIEQSLSKNKLSLLKALQIADHDITDIQIKKEPRISKNINANISTNEVSIDEVKRDFYVITTFHKSNPNISFNFNQEESGGTRVLFYLMMTILDVIQHNKILLLDEIETSLHSKIVEYIISLFHAGKNAQLIYTTHNTNLLDLNKLRKDQIYFVNKKPDASTELYSLFDFKDFRETMDAEKAYLQGRFNAIPYIDDSPYNIKSLFTDEE